MENILEWLFHSELSSSMSEHEVQQFAKVAETLQELTKALTKAVPQEKNHIFTSYCDNLETYQNMTRRIEFERGFIMGVRLLFQVFSK